jgi:20S proteasome subunit beta 4
MECVIGIQGKDFALVASDTNQVHSIVVMKQGKSNIFLTVSVCFMIKKFKILSLDDDKLFKINDHCVMLATGEPGDKVQFAEYIQRNLQLYKMINGEKS